MGNAGLTLWQQTLPRISAKSKLAEAIRDAIARREIVTGRLLPR